MRYGVILIILAPLSSPLTRFERCIHHNLGCRLFGYVLDRHGHRPMAFDGAATVYL
jgi:hypothetical protein